MKRYKRCGIWSTREQLEQTPFPAETRHDAEIIKKVLKGLGYSVRIEPAKLYAKSRGWKWEVQAIEKQSLKKVM